jgi:uncharacterized membrane protein
VKAEHAATAKLLVVLLAFAWGFNWIAAAEALKEVPPWSFRFAGAGIGAAMLFSAALLSGYNLRVPRGERRHVMVAGFCNVTAFQILSAFAQLNGATSRAIIITYSMPIWAALLSWLMLRERLDGIRLLAFVLCVAGITTLVWPLFAGGLPVFVFYSLGCALGWRRCHRSPTRPGNCCSASFSSPPACSSSTVIRDSGRCTCNRFWRSSMSVFSASGSHIFCGGRSSAGCRPSPLRSARCWCR